MSDSDHDQQAARDDLVRLLPPLLILLLALFPPETRGESLAGCAALIFLLAAAVRPAAPSASRGLPLTLWLLLAFPLVLAAKAPGSAVEPWLLVGLALAAGGAVAGLAGGARSRSATAWALALAGAGVAVWAVYQSVWGLHTLADRLAEGWIVPDRDAMLARARSGRGFAGFPTPAALGGYLVLALPPTVLFGLGQRGGRRAGLLGLAALQLGGLVASASATAAAALLGALLLAALVRPRMRRAAAVAAAALVAVLAGVAVSRGAEVLRWSDPNSPWRLRAANYRLAAEMIADHPFVGVGLGGFGEVYPAYRRPDDNETRHVHDLPLELAAELGLPVGAAGAALFLWVFVAPLLRRRRASADSGLRAGLEIGLAAFALHNLVDFTAFLPSVAWTAALLRGWLAAPATEPLPVAPSPRRTDRPLAFAPALAAALIAATIAVGAGLAGNDRFAARLALAEGKLTTVERRAGRAARLAPWQVDGWLLWAEGAPDPTLALERVERAIALSPVRPAARAQRARLRIGAGDVPGAWADAVEAARLYPSSSDYARLRDALAERLPRPPAAP